MKITHAHARAPSRLGAPLLALLLAAGAAAQAATDGASLEKPTPFPGGVADPSRGIGYTADAKGIIAVRLRDGARLWKYEGAWRPLVASGGWLVASRASAPQTLTVVVLDAARAARQRLSADVKFPEWVSVSTFDGEVFSYAAVLRHGARRPTDLVLAWEAHSRYRGGANPPPFVLEQQRRDETGAWLIDLTGGRVSRLAESDAAVAADSSPPCRDREALRREPGASEACAVGARAYYSVETPAGKCALRARSVSTGRLLWELPLACRPAARPGRLKA
ncbi:MAG: hypothetical protein LC746_05695 [Acidobacteria bacterium]|nr:hypothetical protein [Acidobacteriota bacterium]